MPTHGPQRSVRLRAQRFPALPLASILALGTLFGCDERARAPVAPLDATIDGQLPQGNVGREDGGQPSDGSVDDGSVFDAASSAWSTACFLDEATRLNQALTVYVNGEFTPFDIAAATSTWAPGSCTTPTVRLGLTDGTCSEAMRGLRLDIETDSLGTELQLGPNLLEKEPANGLSVRFYVGGKSYGTCQTPAGSISFTSLGKDVGETVAATLDMTLEACDGSGDKAALNGQLAIPIIVARADGCP